MHLPFNEGGHPLSTADLLAAVADTRPVSRWAAETMDAIRQWGATHACPAGQDPRRTPAAQVERLQA